MRYDEITGESQGEVFKKLREKHGSNAYMIKIYETEVSVQETVEKKGFFGKRQTIVPTMKKIWVGKCGVPENEQEWKEIEKRLNQKKNIEEPKWILEEKNSLGTGIPEREVLATNVPESEAYQKLSGEFSELKNLINHLLTREVDENETQQAEESQQIFKEYLLKNDFSLDFSDRFIESLTVPAINLETFEVILKEKLRLGIPVVKGFPAEAGRFFMLMGPTGVGKTTTLAKLAAIYYRKNPKIRFLTFDSYRLGAARQLEMVSEIFEKPFHLIQNLEEMKAFLKTLKDDETVFIDTAGESIAKDLRLSEVTELLKQLPGKVCRILALPANGKSLDLAKIKEKFRVFLYDYYIITKLDETCSMGAILSSLYKDQVPAAYFTFGQEVPEDMGEADIEKLLSFLK